MAPAFDDLAMCGWPHSEVIESPDPNEVCTCVQTEERRDAGAVEAPEWMCQPTANA